MVRPADGATGLTRWRIVPALVSSPHGHALGTFCALYRLWNLLRIHACQGRKRGTIETRMKGGTRVRSNEKPAATDRRRQLITIAMDFIASKGFEGFRTRKSQKQRASIQEPSSITFPTKKS